MEYLSEKRFELRPITRYRSALLLKQAELFRQLRVELKLDLERNCVRPVLLSAVL
jgi:hypothetical protein